MRFVGVAFFWASCDQDVANSRKISSAGRAQPTPPIAQCSGGGGLPPSLQMQAEVLELDVQGLMAPGQQVRAFAFVLVVRPVPGRALLLGGQLAFELLDPRLECGNHIGHRQAAWGPYGQRLVLQLVKINSDQGLTILVVRARQAVALDDGARALGRDVEAVANLHVGELFEHPASHHPSGWAP